MNYIVIPTYRERDNIEPMAEAVLALGLEYRVIVVDDISTDGTREKLNVLRERYPNKFEVMFRNPPRSFAGSYVEGFRRALSRSDCECVIECDADGSHPMRRIPELVAKLTAADVAIGSRYVPGGNISGFSKDRLLLSFMANAYLRFGTRLRIRDITAGFVAYRAELLHRIPYERITSNGYAFQIEMKWLCNHAGARFVEMPITFSDRSKGHSKMSFKTVIEAYLIGLRYAWKSLMHSV